MIAVVVDDVVAVVVDVLRRGFFQFRIVGLIRTLSLLLASCMNDVG